MNELSGKKVVFVTGTRADFGKLKPLIVASRDIGANVIVYVTGMHMLRKYGNTKVEVHRLNGVEIHESLNQNTTDPQDAILAKTISQFSDFVQEQAPDLVVIHGDRVEALACALVCATNYIISAHIEGGEVSGTIDESFRHCASKLCTYHFTSSQLASTRLKMLGEEEWRILQIGSPELDLHAAQATISIDDVKHYYDIPFDEYGICVFHPVTSEQKSIGSQAKCIASAMVASKKDFVVIMPNNDPGHRDIMKEFEKLPSDNFKMIPSIRFEYFSVLMKNSKCILGNSSLGVREAPFLGKQSINIGRRQTNRSACPSIINYNTEGGDGSLSELLSLVWGKSYPPDRAFGSGNAANEFINRLLDKKFWCPNHQKVFVNYEF